MICDMRTTINEPIAVGPDRILRIKLEEFGPDRVRYRGHGHGSARMTAVGLLDAVHGEAADRVNDELLLGVERIIDHVGILMFVDRSTRGVVCWSHGCFAFDVMTCATFFFLLVNRRDLFTVSTSFAWLLCLRCDALCNFLLSFVNWRDLSTV